MLPISGLAQARRKAFQPQAEMRSPPNEVWRLKGALPLTSEHHIQLIAECGVFAFGYPYAQLATISSALKTINRMM